MTIVDWDQVEHNWHQFKGMVKERWDKLTDEDLDMMEGTYHQLAEKLQRSYGIAREEAERQIQEFMTTLDKMHARREPGSEGSDTKRRQKKAGARR
jgi:uncharacterized protein YjbJ (UPF0337 family)